MSINSRSMRTNFLQINAGLKKSSIRVEAWHESEAGVLNAEVFSNSSATTKLTAVSSEHSFGRGLHDPVPT